MGIDSVMGSISSWGSSSQVTSNCYCSWAKVCGRFCNIVGVLIMCSIWRTEGPRQNFIPAFWKKDQVLCAMWGPSLYCWNNMFHRSLSNEAEVLDYSQMWDYGLRELVICIVYVGPRQKQVWLRRKTNNHTRSLVQITGSRMCKGHFGCRT